MVDCTHNWRFKYKSKIGEDEFNYYYCIYCLAQAETFSEGPLLNLYITFPTSTSFIRDGIIDEYKQKKEAGK